MQVALVDTAEDEVAIPQRVLQHVRDEVHQRLDIGGLHGLRAASGQKRKQSGLLKLIVIISRTHNIKCVTDETREGDTRSTKAQEACHTHPPPHAATHSLRPRRAPSRTYRIFLSVPASKEMQKREEREHK